MGYILFALFFAALIAAGWYLAHKNSAKISEAFGDALHDLGADRPDKK